MDMLTKQVARIKILVIKETEFKTSAPRKILLKIVEICIEQFPNILKF